MKISHLSILFVIIILPFSIICRHMLSERMVLLEDRVRLNNVLDISTQDALDTLVELNDEFQMLYLNERFNITPSLAQEAVNSFFKTMAVNFNLPYIEGKTQNYFSQYVPAIVIIGYDGFYIYSIDEKGDNTYAYQMSPKIPYTYYDTSSGALISFTLGNYVRIYTNDRLYEGELTDDYIEQTAIKYEVYESAFAYEADSTSEIKKVVYENIAELTNDLSVILYADREVNRGNGLPDFFFVSSGDANAIPLTRDYNTTSHEDASLFHSKRREVILSVIKETLQQEMNEHNAYAHLMGSIYNFTLPEVADDDWTNSINDISVMAFIQGMKVGINSYYDDYALGGSRIIQTEYLYGTGSKELGNGVYHYINCEDILEDQSNLSNIFINRVQAAQAGYWPCLKCNP